MIICPITKLIINENFCFIKCKRIFCIAEKAEIDPLTALKNDMAYMKTKYAYKVYSMIEKYIEHIKKSKSI